MTTAGPWLDNAMWRPDEDTPEPPKVVREHYFIVSAVVREDGSYAWNVETDLDCFEMNQPVFVHQDERWTRVLPEYEDLDRKALFDLFGRLR